MATQINAAAMQALAAYGGSQRPGAPTPAPASQGQSFEDARRQTVRQAQGVTVELSQDARATLIAIQSAASDGSGSTIASSARSGTGTYEAPGGRLDLSV